MQTLALPRRPPADLLLIGLALGHGLLLACCPSLVVVALGFWWNANTISHNFIHRPFFRSRTGNALFSMYLTLLLGVPQTLWRERHLAHHADRTWRVPVTGVFLWECGLVAGLWGTLALGAPRFFFLAYLPGWALGLAICWVHGHQEHARGTTSHYGRLYNLLFFNDGYHIEHHDRPGLHWRELPKRCTPSARASRWPAPLRWLETFSLEGLERLLLRSPRLARWVVRAHERAIRRLVEAGPHPRKITIVGGGLFPRTPLIFSRLFPEAEITVIEENAEHIESARPRVAASIVWVHGRFQDRPQGSEDLLVIPLAFRGDRVALYDRPTAPLVLVHDWAWRRRGKSAIVSALLLKRVNLVSA